MQLIKTKLSLEQTFYFCDGEHKKHGMYGVDDLICEMYKQCDGEKYDDGGLISIILISLLFEIFIYQYWVYVVCS